MAELTKTKPMSLCAVKTTLKSTVIIFTYCLYLFPLGCVCLEEPQGCPGVPVSLCPELGLAGNTLEL